MVRDDLQIGKPIHDSGKDESGERRAGLERPANHAANLVFRNRLAAIVGHFARANGMQQDRLARLLDDFIDREELGLIYPSSIHLRFAPYRISHLPPIY